MGLMFFLGIPLLPPLAKIRAWGFGGDEKQFRIKDIFVGCSAGVSLAAIRCGPAVDGCGAALEVGLRPLVLFLQLLA